METQTPEWRTALLGIDRMARYCFYCNKELKPGERCDCREARKVQARNAEAAARAAGTAGATGSSTSTTQGSQTGNSSPFGTSSSTTSGGTSYQSTGSSAAPNSGSKKVSLKDRWNAWRQRAQQRRREREQSAWSSQTSGAEYARRKADPASGASCFDDRSAFSFRGFFGKLKLYFTDPITAIRYGIRGNLAWAFILLFIQCLLIGIMSLQTFRHSNLGNLLMFTAIRPYNRIDFNSLFLILLLAETLLMAILFLAKALVYQVTLRTMGRQRLRFCAVLRMLIPALVYYTCFLIVGNITAAGSGITTILILLSGIAINSVVEYLSIREVTGLNDNKLVVVVFIALLIQCLLSGAIISLSLPNISGFTFSPVSALT